jgi:6-pyruvoyltetrahydropterin/6-carboxytetrahydropterin synthase
MRYELSQRFFFEAAHTLQREIDPEPSRRIHGHTYLAEVTVTGVPDPSTGMLVDLGYLRSAIESVRQCLDHRLLDEVEGLGSATLENLCAYIWQRMGDFRWQLESVVIRREASGDSCRLRGPSAAATAIRLEHDSLAAQPVQQAA